MIGGRWLYLVALIFGLGCSDECPDIGCGSSLIIELAPEQGFADGAYEVTLESGGTGGSSMVCGFVIAGGNASMLGCSPDNASVDNAELPTFMLVRYFTEQPTTLHVVVTLDGAELVEQDVTPEYENVFWDSDACGGGACTSAQVSVGF